MLTAKHIIISHHHHHRMACPTADIAVPTRALHPSILVDSVFDDKQLLNQH